ncbi:hypothetical protein D3C80_1831940 [compost metagenome]
MLRVLLDLPSGTVDVKQQLFGINNYAILALPEIQQDPDTTTDDFCGHRLGQRGSIIFS